MKGIKSFFIFVVIVIGLMAAVAFGIRMFSFGSGTGQADNGQAKQTSAESQNEQETVAELKTRQIEIEKQLEEERRLRVEQVETLVQTNKDLTKNLETAIGQIENQDRNPEELDDYIGNAINNALSSLGAGGNTAYDIGGANSSAPLTINDYNFTTPPDLQAQGVKLDTAKLQSREVAPQRAQLPAYTLLPGTKIFNAKLLDSIIAEIPLQGRFNSEFEFSVSTSEVVLTANGHNIPGIAETIWTGVATGNYTLGCADTRLTKLTVVFEDGTYDLIEANRARPLAKLSMSNGVTCIEGDFYSNGKSLLAGIGAIEGLELAGQVALADATDVQTAFGQNSNLSITNRTRALGGAFTTGFSRRIQDYLQNFLESANAIIFVPLNEMREVDIRITSEILINYNNTDNARRVDQYAEY